MATVCETKAWVWTLAGRPGHDELVVGCDGGSIRVQKLHFQHVTAIYKVSSDRTDNILAASIGALAAEQPSSCVVANPGRYISVV